ncbi:hypothetical protein M378DRAFT_169500 [Amanita muscaria Koide BX008]|uniref:F-box domain-containing protein n=1 Tax=Amanita muscaria (strain Koide BX008) TaxID=946122 RepID=A0A0C2S8W1_AMAMK|nr:hypothetical protein M378DRAFT_169500 [Amanita muscaria Koide BX008]
MAVVSKVPTEVLTEIFYLLCKKPISVSKLNNSRRKKDFPWAVGLVCRRWRTTFLSYPPIWASLELSDGVYDSFKPDKRTESYSKEINRRLALYLERSGGYPLRLDICLWSDQNRELTMMALEMLLACSHRWQTAKFRLVFCHWSLDSILLCKGQLPILEWLEFSGNMKVLPKHARTFEVAPRLTHACIGPCAQSCGWILPWTQLTELLLTLSGAFVIENGDVQNLLPMLHNIKELRFRFNYYEVDFEGGFPQFAPTPLNQLRVLEVPHPAILSWFEAPSLCELYFADYKKHNDEPRPLDVREQISSLIQRSSCRIRKLAFNSCRKFYVGTLEDVEELVIEYQRPYGIRSSIDISSLLNLRFLTIICWTDKDFESSITSLSTALKSPTRSECSYGTSISLLERVMVELHYRREQSEILKRRLEILRR